MQLTVMNINPNESNDLRINIPSQFSECTQMAASLKRKKKPVNDWLSLFKRLLDSL